MEKCINLNGLNLYYDETGPEDTPPVILMHGWGCNSSTVASIASALATDRKVYSMDLPGHGKSQEPPFPWGIEDFTRLVENFTKTLNIKNPTLIGHSFGGRIAIMMGSRNDIRNIVLVDAAGIKPKRKLKYYIKVYSFKIARRILPFLVGKKKAGNIIDKWRNKSGSADYKASSPMMRAVMSKCVNEDLKGVMPYIKAPTLLIWGEKDTATPLSDAQTMNKLIPDSGLVSFPGAGHYSFLDEPVRFRTIIRNFLIQ